MLGLLTVVGLAGILRHRILRASNSLSALTVNTPAKAPNPVRGDEGRKWQQSGMPVPATMIRELDGTRKLAQFPGRKLPYTRVSYHVLIFILITRV